ncbi:polysaccharide deacetylase family protein [Ectothiorhodospira variabilis]|uniref:polysaccharide deacetylase family protein n=1 Tax=Ectothiorhodospira variabilis TaxID=505694 RepID=UPI001EFC1AEB|nr:polysaccharide deacetylase family protein [Ectothiorhodospira variabilis]MCG5497803.1 polysaccharide deacetylase family protein [Ectothiorhodospira variabilis]
MVSSTENAVLAHESLPPAFVISLDFELHWGVSERVDHPEHPYNANLYGAREVVPRLLELFQRRKISATWATVGKLFADGAEDLAHFVPTRRPAYHNKAVDTYRLPLGTSEQEDPLHFAPSLVQMIKDTPGQELACHTFSHYYCDEAGQDVDSFQADLEAACTITSREGVQCRSFVFPRNQVLPDYLAVLHTVGLDVYRGNPARGLFGLPGNYRLLRAVIRGLRLADSFVNLTGHHTVPWSSLREGSLVNVRASQLLRPYSHKLRAFEPLRRHRVKAGLRAAARSGEIFHLWWHPHNFGKNMDENLTALEDILDEFERLRQSHGMRSMTMDEVADVVFLGIDEVTRGEEVPG